MTEWIISSVVLIVVVALVRQLLKGKISLRLQYALWAIVLVRLLVPITFGESKISVLNVLEQTASVVEQQEPAEEPTVSDPAWEPIGGNTTPIPTESVGTPVLTPGVPVDPYPVISELPEPVVPIVPDPGTTSDPVEEPEPPAVDEPVGAPVVTVVQILTVLWLCGIAVVGLWFLFTNLRFWLRLRRSRRALALESPIRVYITGAAETPCLFGLIRPAVYLTPEVAEDEVALRHVLAHELTHYHHWDHIWSVLRCVCLAVHWYNPLVWLAASLSRRDAELACDESTIRRIGEEERTAYGRTLIGLTCVHRSNLLHTATTMTGSKKSLRERIVLIAKKPKMAIYTLVAVILIAAIAVGCTFTGPTVDPEQAQPPEGLPGEIVTSATYPSDPEEYYLVAKLPGESIWLYARDHGEKTLLVYGDVRQEYDHRVHTTHLTLPRLTMLNDNYLAVVSEVNTGTQVGVEQLVVYDLEDLASYVYDWRAIAEEFNRNNTLIYNKEMNSFTLEYHEQTYITGTLNTDMSTYLDLEDGFTGTLIASGQSVRYQIKEDGTITVTMQTCVGRSNQGGFDAEGFWSYSDYYPMSGGAAGVELNWNVSFDQGQFRVDPQSISFAGVYKIVKEEPVAPDAERIAYFQELLTWDGGTTHFNGALTCAFDSPEDINLEYVFYTGFPGGEGWSDFTEEEKAYLIAEGMRREIGVQKRSAKQLNDALQAYFGVSLSQVQSPNSWVYYEATDSYYSGHSDTHVMERFTVTKVEQGADGLIYVYYTAEGPIYRQDGTTLDGWEHDMVLTLRGIASHWGSPNDSGYMVVANQTLSDFERFVSGAGTADESPMMKTYRRTMSAMENVTGYGFYNFGRYGGEGYDELIVETKTGEMSRTYHFFTYTDGEVKKIGTQEVASPYVLVASDGTGLILAGQWSKEIIWRITWEQGVFDSELLLEREVVSDECKGWPATIPMYNAKTNKVIEIRYNYWPRFAYYSNVFPIKLVLPKEWEELLTFQEGPSVRHSELDAINIYVEEGRDYENPLSGHMGAVYRFDPVDWDTRRGVPGDFFEYGGITMELGRTDDSVYILQLSCALNEYWDMYAPGFESYRVIQNCLVLGAYEIYSHTPARSIEDTVTGFLNEYLTELYCYTNSNWLDYTTGSIHIYGVDELSEEEQVIVWAADRNISYLEDKADYRKLLRRYSEMYIQDLTITFANMKVSQNGKDATVNLDAFVSFYNEGNAEQLAAPQKTYEIRLAKIGGEWLITDVTEAGFDDTYKDNRAVLDKVIDALVDTYFSDNLVFRYDSNGDGMIQSVEFPYAEGEAFGLTGEYATLYTAVAEYVMRWSANELGYQDLVLPSITRVYGQYKDEQGNVNCICSMNTLYFYSLGEHPGEWTTYDIGGAGNFVLATLDPDGYLVGLKTWPNSPGQERANELYREYCGPLEDLAEAFINGTQSAFGEEILTEYRNADARLAQYLAYYFGG